ncbi:hypothetical protein [Roseibium alexandrii]|uniref:PilZ domain-containing protein n=1 Tax=Roseibium alexandrii (strain DSM 17067 / NCIMB 14079 / DFL-11) TaxID=244592 RepID=A0A5E8GWE2_ROSAD|nr:hypothetical protein [Roseibium alexandrii]EEE43900.2 hypothetical protein SADFL11_1186 [Roseibium alexandrii DFL-11]
MDHIAVAVKNVADEMSQGIEGFLNEMARDVEERRRANRKQERGQQIHLISESGEHIRTRLMNSSEGGIGVMNFHGAVEGMHVTYEDTKGHQYPMAVKWVYEDTVGLQYLTAERSEEIAA